ncbi:MAG: DUF4019 domain-containing protein [Bacteroidota bacterium]
MKYSKLFILILGLAFFSVSAFAQHEEATQQAQGQAEVWLPLVDEGNYAGSWEEAASVFQQSVTKEQWGQAAKQVREPLGNVKSRDLRKAEYTTSLPNAPKGEYVLIEYTASFVNQQNLVETVVMSKTESEEWATIGYFIQPG